MYLLIFLVSLYSFFVSIEMLSGAFKLFGSGLAQALITNTSNPLVGLSIGILATSLVQSSSSTTSIVVGMVASGSMTIRNAVPIIMGANIGTTVTNTLVSIGHITKRKEFEKALGAATVHDFFNILAVIILLPLEVLFHPIEKSAYLFGTLFQKAGGFKAISPLKVIVKPVVHFIIKLLGHHPVPVLIVALVLLFVSLKYIVVSMKKLTVSRAERYLDKLLFKNPANAFLFGLILTSLVQSSSVTTSLAVPMVAAGLLTVYQVFPYTLGANVGTTVTAILAALVTKDLSAIVVAFSHLLFNIFGIVIIYFFLKKIPITLSGWLARTATRKKYIVIAYIVLCFYIIPLTIIILGR